MVHLLLFDCVACRCCAWTPVVLQPGVVPKSVSLPLTRLLLCFLWLYDRASRKHGADTALRGFVPGTERDADIAQGVFGQH